MFLAVVLISFVALSGVCAANTKAADQGEAFDFPMALDGVPGTHVYISVCDQQKPDGTFYPQPIEATCVLANDCITDCTTQIPAPRTCIASSCWRAKPLVLIRVSVLKSAVVTSMGTLREGGRWSGCSTVRKTTTYWSPDAEAFRAKLYADPTLCLTLGRSYGNQIWDFTAAEPFQVTTRPAASPFDASQLAFRKPRTFSTETIVGGHFSITTLGMAAYDAVSLKCLEAGTNHTLTTKSQLPLAPRTSSNASVKFSMWLGKLPSGTLFHCTARLLSTNGITAPAPLAFDVKTRGAAQPQAGNAGVPSGSSGGVSGVGPIGL